MGNLNDLVERCSSDEDPPITVLPPLSPSEVRPLLRRDWAWSGPDSSDTDSDLKDFEWKNSRMKVAQIRRRYREDHPRAFGNREDVPLQPFPFFKLPAELRQVILCFHLKYKKPVQQLPPRLYYNSRRRMRLEDTQVFAVSRQMRAEAQSAFSVVNTLRINLWGNDGREGYEGEGLPLWITSPQIILREVRSVNVCAHCSPWATMWVDWPRTRAALKQMCHLERLTISPSVYSLRDEGGPWGFGQDWIQALKSLDGLCADTEIMVPEMHRKAHVIRLIGLSKLLSTACKRKIP